MYKGLIIGTSLGFATFIIGTMCTGNVYFRPSSDGTSVFTFANLFEFLKAPFMVNSSNFDTVWSLYDGITVTDRVKLLQLNWLLLTVGMGTIGYLIENYCLT